MDDATLELLRSTLTIDLTTIGAKTGTPSRVEIWAWWFEGRYIITGTPGPRDWLANVTANDSVVVHVRGIDLSGRARLVKDREFRRRFFESSETRWYSTQAQLDSLVTEAPMIEIVFV